MAEVNSNQCLEDTLKICFHPNRISVLGAGLSVVSISALYFESTKHIAPAIYGLSAVSDYLDGKVATMFDLKTKEGAKIDPLMDKIKNIAVGSYMVCNEFSNSAALVIANAANFAVDYISQKRRGLIADQIRDSYFAVRYPQNTTKDVEKESCIRANYFGKTKTVLQNIVHAGYITSIAYSHEIITFLNIPAEEFTNLMNDSCTAVLMVSAALGAKGIYNRTKK